MCDKMQIELTQCNCFGVLQNTSQCGVEILGIVRSDVIQGRGPEIVEGANIFCGIYAVQ